MRATLSLLLLVAATAAIVGLVACGSSKSSSPDGGGDMGPPCVMNPTTHLEIINACTTAQSYDKTPFYPALAPGGVLPALP